MSGPVVLAVDGGNSKTDLALVGDDGALLALVRGPLSSPHHLGRRGCARTCWTGCSTRRLVDRGPPAGEPVADVARAVPGGRRLPSEEEQMRDALEERRLGRRVPSSATTPSRSCARAPQRGWGVAVVCGAGINCVGVAPDGRVGALSRARCDHGRLGRRLRRRARRALRRRPQRGPAWPCNVSRAHRSRPLRLRDAARARRGDPRRRDPARRLIELAPLVLESCSTDGVAAEIVDRLAEEVVTMVRSALARLGLEHEPTDVVLGRRAARGRERPAARRDRHRPPRARPAARASDRRTPRPSSAPRCSGSTRSAPGPRPTIGRGVSCRRRSASTTS